MSYYLKSVNFGTAKTGLSTVGYTLYDKTGSVLRSRSTSGVHELGTSGIYVAEINFPNEACVLLWDSGEVTPRYAQDESTIQLNAIQDETDKIRTIWNTIQNNGKLYEILINKIEKIKPADIAKLHDELRKEIRNIKFPSLPTIEDIRSALHVTVPAPKVPAPIVNIPKTVIPDYTSKLTGLSEAINELGSKLNLISSDLKKDLVRLIADVSQTARAIIGELSEARKKIEQGVFNKIEESSKPISKTDDLKSAINAVLSEINRIQKAADDIDKRIINLNENVSDTMKPGKLLQDIYQVIKQTEELNTLVEENKKIRNKLRVSGLG